MAIKGGRVCGKSVATCLLASSTVEASGAGFVGGGHADEGVACGNIGTSARADSSAHAICDRDSTQSAGGAAVTGATAAPAEGAVTDGAASVPRVGRESVTSGTTSAGRSVGGTRLGSTAAGGGTSPDESGSGGAGEGATGSVERIDW